ncbi:hypothetical protein [Nostoc sp.]|uniref:hypothetical protein n=1 Tax=Nostoc sp. TaxID=1180 RepID=UPI002FF63981
MSVVSIRLGYAIASWQDLPTKGRVEMLRLLADENFNNQIVRVILEWAAQQGRILLTHDVETITRYAYERVQAGLQMPGVFEISRSVSVGLAIEDILLIAEGSFEGEWEGQVQYLPLR